MKNNNNNKTKTKNKYTYKQSSKQTNNKDHQHVSAWKPKFTLSILGSHRHCINIIIFF